MSNGGARKGAGRKPLFKERMVSMKIDVPKAVKLAWLNLENPTAWARRVITENLLKVKDK